MPTLSWTNGHGKRVSAEYHTTVDALKFEDMPQGMAWVLLAANTHLSVDTLVMVLEEHGIYRGRGWVQKRRWLFRERNGDRVENPDGKDDQAIKLMRDYPKDSARHLVEILKQNGISRGKTWVWQHRCDYHPDIDD